MCSTITINKIDKTGPSISDAVVSPAEWSSEDGSVTVTAVDSGAGIKDYSFDGGATWQTSNIKTYTGNTSGIVIKVRDQVNNISTYGATLSIDKIDKTAPTISEVEVPPSSDWSTSDATITVYASDSQSGVKDYSFDNGATWQTSNTKIFTENIRGINITNIDRTGPEIPLIYEYMGLVYLYSGDEQVPDDYEVEPDTVSMQYKIGASGEWTDYNDETGIEIQRNQDVTVYARSFDAAGNASQETVKTFRADYAVYMETNTDGQVNSVSYTFPFDRSYRSDKSGWTFAFDSHIENPYSENGQENVITAVLPNGESVTFLCRMYGSTNSVYTTRDGKYNLSFFLNQYLQGYEVYFEDYGTFVYDLEGRLVSIRDKNYGYIDITHEENKVTIASRDFGKSYTYMLDEQGNPVSLTDPMGGVTHFSYDPDGNLQTVTDPSGVVVGEYSYDSSGKMTKSQKADIAYGPDGGLASITQQNGSKTSYAFDADQNAVESIVTDTAGNSIRYTYDNQLRILSQSSDGSTTTYTYDEEGRMASSVTDGQTTTYTYDEHDNLICTTSPDGSTQESLYYYGDISTAGYSYGDLIREKDAEGNYTYYNYDTHNNVTITAKLKPLEGGQTVPESYLPTSDQSLFEVTANTYQRGLLVGSEDRENNITESYTYDDSGNLIQQTTTKPKEGAQEAKARSGGEMETETVTYTYDAMGRVLTSTKDGKTTSYIYDAAGRTLKETADGSVTRSLYDSKGRLVQQIANDQYVAADDGLNATPPANTYANPNVGHRYTYAANGNLASETNANDLVTNYTYDQYGNMTTQSFDLYTFTHMVSGDVSSAKIGDKTLVSYDYSADAKKLLTKTSYANGQAIEYAYSGDKVVGVKFSGDSGYRFEYAYDEDGEMTQKIDRVSGLKYVFTSEDVKVYDMSNGETLVRNYTVNSDLFTETVNHVTYSSEFLENRDKFILSETQSVNRTYTKDSGGKLTTARIYQLSGEEETTAFTTSFTYDGDDNITAINYLLNGTALNLSYTYDGDGKVTSVTQNGIGTSYVYDADGQLVRVNDGRQNKTVTYSYDARGNLLSRSEYAYTTGELDSVEPLETVPYVYGDTSWPDLLTSYNGEASTYDATGNRLTHDGWIYEWEGGRQLKQMSKGEDTYSYTYDDNGIRQSKTVNGVTTAYTTIDGKITSQTDGTNTLYFRYSSDETPLGFQLNGTEYLYILNLQGDIIGVADLNGTIVTEYAYDTWGKVLSITGSMVETVGRLNPMRYRGYYYLGQSAEYNRFYGGDGRTAQPHALPGLLLRFRNRVLLPSEQVL